jgi:hypothetical protein
MFNWQHNHADTDKHQVEKETDIMRDDQAVKEIKAKVDSEDVQEALDMYWELRDGPVLPEEALELVFKEFGKDAQ